MKLDPIPMHVDILEMVYELNGMGWPDYKIEIAAGVGQGYIAQMRRGRIINPGYQTAARFYNFWITEAQPEGAARPAPFDRGHALSSDRTT